MSKEVRRDIFRGMGNPIYRYTYTDKDSSSPPSSPISQWFGFRWPRKQTILIFINMVLMFALLHHLSKLPAAGQESIAVPAGTITTTTTETTPIYQMKPGADSFFRTDDPSSKLSGSDLAEYLYEQARKLTDIEFPKKIWQTWKTISLPQLEDYKNPNSWHFLNPSHEYELLTDKGAEKYVVDNYNDTDPFIVHLFQNFKQRILAADLLRYLVTFKSGGLYTDIDTECHYPIDEWIGRTIKHLPEVDPKDINIVIGMELDILDKEKYSDSWVIEAGFTQRIQFLQWAIMAKPGHEIMRRTITSIQEKIRKDIENSVTKDLRDIRYDERQILDRTGPFGWTAAIQGYINQIENRTVPIEEYGNITEGKKIGDVLFLPVNRWSPGVPHSNAGPDETSFLIHHFKGAWRGTINLK